MDDEWSPEDGVIEQLCGSWRGCGEGKLVPVSLMDRFSSLKHVDDVVVSAGGRRGNLKPLT